MYFRWHDLLETKFPEVVLFAALVGILQHKEVYVNGLASHEQVQEFLSIPPDKHSCKILLQAQFSCTVLEDFD